MANPRNQAAVEMLREQLGGAAMFFLVIIHSGMRGS